MEFNVKFNITNQVVPVKFKSVQQVTAPGEGGFSYEIGHGLKVENNVLSVNSADGVEQDNTLPITSAAVYATVGNIGAILDTI